MRTSGSEVMKGTLYILLLAAAPTWRAALAAEPIQPTVDTRQQVLLAPFPSLKLRIEMRRMLQSVHEIIGGATSDDLATVERSARAAGRAGAADTDPQIEHRVPPGFHDLGLQTHRTFDALAEQAKAG